MECGCQASPITVVDARSTSHGDGRYGVDLYKSSSTADLNPIDAVDATRRSVTSTTAVDGRDAKQIVAERTYPAPAADVWDALTNTERLPRWFAPVSGDLHLGGRYAIEGNASGTITVVRAAPPPGARRGSSTAT